MNSTEPQFYVTIRFVKERTLAGLAVLILLAPACGGSGGRGNGANGGRPVPSNVAAVAGISQVTVTWTPVAGATSYNIYRATAPGVTKVNYTTIPGGTLLTGVSSPFVNASLTPGTTYRFVVTAVDPTGESGESVEVSATPVAIVPEVFFDGERDMVGRVELYVADNSGNVLNLSGPLVSGGNVIRYSVSNNRQWVAFVADKEVVGRAELYIIPAVGGTPVKVSGTMVAGGNVDWFLLWSPDDTKVLFRADREVDGTFELYTAGTSGGAPTKVSGTMVAGGNVDPYTFRWAGNSRVVYQADEIVVGRMEVFSALATGGGLVNLSQSVAAGAAAGNFSVSWDGSLVAFVGKAPAATFSQLYVEPVGGGAPTLLTEGLRDITMSASWSPDSSRLAYVEWGKLCTINPDSSNRIQTSATAVSPGSNIAWSSDGTYLGYKSWDSVNGWRDFTSKATQAASEVDISAPLGSGEIVQYPPDWSPVSDLLLYTKGGTVALYCTSAGTSGGGVKLAASPSGINGVAWAPDGSRVAFLADSSIVGSFELWTTLPSGGPGVNLSGTPLSGSASALNWSGDSLTLYFTAALDVAGTVELYSVGPTGGPIKKLSGVTVSGGKVRYIWPAR